MDEFSYPFSTLENVKSKGFYKTWLQFQSNKPPPNYCSRCTLERKYSTLVLRAREGKKGWPYHPEWIPSHLIMEVKRGPACLKRERKEQKGQTEIAHQQRKKMKRKKKKYNLISDLETCRKSIYRGNKRTHRDLPMFYGRYHRTDCCLTAGNRIFYSVVQYSQVAQAQQVL